ncbi:phytanoyl-CoA dioxygenase family protein [Saccharothrix luteola]|uniref:phytanoyl-CoA dioxygenase family protein n=1 Tax=Saccharothrix luteola TaxID=2893018 RepID=UPI001E302237|nr:phytanoyl-CoA dioxygenase family protein [Saccharothrix luteola]MCC8243007.1 phytanoyl-CoA dioxygenase family protein [Saccharothrix luteola]
MEHYTAVPPTPTTDLGTASSDLAESGYCVVADVLGRAELTALRAGFAEVEARDRAAGNPWYSRGNYRITALLNHGPEFVALAEHPTALALTEQLLGPHHLLSSITAHVTLPGNTAQSVHADQQYIPEPWSYAMGTQACWLLDDFTEANGGTVILPGSHLAGRAPTKEEVTAATTVSITATAGSLLVLDGRVWHRAGVNTTPDTIRRGIFAHYCSPFIRQQENFFRSLRPEVRSGLSPTMRRLLGYDIWEGLGTVDGLPVEWMGTGRRTGPTNADGLFDT